MSPQRPFVSGAPRRGARPARAMLPLALAAMLPLALGGCARRAEPPRVTVRWVAGVTAPRFDPDGPPHATRWALERWLSRGLTALDTAGRAVPDAAERWQVSSDSLTWTFHLRDSLAFTDGTPCGSEAFATALAAGLARPDHATRPWLLAALAGVERVRVRKPLPPLGLETPDARTLVVRLTRPEPALPARLALPGVSAPWRSREPGSPWASAVGLGPYGVRAEEPGRALTLTRADGRRGTGVDTLEVRFAIGAPRVRTWMRSGRADLVWPLPPALLDEALPAGWSRRERDARPARTLVLALRADSPPTHHLPARAAVAHALNRRAALDALGAVGRPVAEWPAGGGAFVAPAYDGASAREWMERGGLGRSFHLALGYDADGAGAAVARALQSEWARFGVDVELAPSRGASAERAALTAGPQLWLAEDQPLESDPAAPLASLVMPLRGPAVGAWRTGWRTREFDPWIWPVSGAAREAAGPLDPAAARARLERELVALPLADLPWVWVVRDAAARNPVHPRFGPVDLPTVQTASQPLDR